MHRHILAAAFALAATTPSAAYAQFTTVVSPPQPEAPPVSVQAQAKVDSAERATLTDLRTWVDSAASASAAATPAPSTGAATAKMETTTEIAAAPATPPRKAETTEFRDGARAPDTASPLPMILLAGLSLLATGLALLLLRPRARPATARSRVPRA